MSERVPVTDRVYLRRAGAACSFLSRRRICGIPVSEVEPIDQFRYAMRWWPGGARGGAVPARFGWFLLLPTSS
jgi:hypothetical protein